MRAGERLEPLEAQVAGRSHLHDSSERKGVQCWMVCARTMGWIFAVVKVKSGTVGVPAMTGHLQADTQNLNQRAPREQTRDGTD